MIVPHNRLLFWTGALVVPAAAFAAAGDAVAVVAGLLVAALAVGVLADAWLGLGGLDGIRVELPDVVRMTKDRDATITVQLANESLRRRRIRLALALPREIASAEAELDASLPEGHETSRLDWSCTPSRRGRYQVEQCALESTSPLGFWAVRRRFPVRCEVRVYPNLLTERNSLAALFLNRGQFGVHAQRQIGKGREFEQLRDYIHGDGFEDIHWKATAKRGRPVTKVFQIERTQEVYVVVDTSRLSGRASVDQMTVLERYLTAALVLGLAAERQGDLFGVMAFGDRVQRFIRAGNGRAHYGVCRDALYNLQPQTGSPDFEELATFIRLRLRRRALLVLLTSLDDPILAEHFERDVQLISRQHLVLVNMLQPAGVAPLFRDGAVDTVDDLYERLGGHLRWHDLRELERVLRRRGVTLSQLEHEKLSAQLVTQYLSVKRRQLL